MPEAPLVVDEDVTLVGKVGPQNRRNTRAGRPFVKAALTLADGSSARCVWWEAASAPVVGATVAVQGTVREYEGRREVSVRSTRLAGEAKQVHRLHRVLSFYLDCVEAEGAQDLYVRPGAHDHVLLASGSDPAMTTPIGTSGVLPRGDAVNRWCNARLMASGGETVMIGYPVVHGTIEEDGRDVEMLSPLCMAECVVERASDGGFALRRTAADVDVNGFALDLLGVSREERNAYLESLAEAEAVGAAATETDRILARLDQLVSFGVLNTLPSLEPESLVPIPDGRGISNTGMVIVSSRSAITRMLLSDFDDLMTHDAGDLARGPLGVFLGVAPAEVVPAAEPVPTILPSNLGQDRAITAALQTPFTVVTGPPGTGKSQVLVNAVAAAVAAGQTVLFASKNNQAVDVVFDRLRLAAPRAIALRTGASGLRPELRRAITTALNRGYPETVDVLGARAGWEAMSRRLQPLYEIERQRLALTEAVAAAQATALELGRGIVPALLVLESPDRLCAAIDEVERALRAFGRRLGMVRRRRRHAARTADADETLARLRAVLGSDAESVVAGLWTVLDGVRDRPSRGSLVDAATPSISVLRDALPALRARESVRLLQGELDALTPEWKLAEELALLDDERVRAGRGLSDALWTHVIVDAQSQHREAAGKLADALASWESAGRGANVAKELVVGALGMFPVWSVTNLSARTNLPLRPGLFDLVIIDEASQCDAASAIPLLYRAKRAMIIGDRRQLTHITALRAEREHRLAQRCGLDDETLMEFDYRTKSCFALAAQRVDERPLLLDQHFRSHPAIISFSNDRFYDGRLVVCTDPNRRLDGDAIRWVDVRGTFVTGPRGRSRMNPQEADVVFDELLREWPLANELNLTVGVVSPYRAQVEAIQERIASHRNDLVGRVVVDSVHRFQGDECDLILFSPVVSEGVGAWAWRHAADPNLVNVAVTRARSRLVIVGDRATCLRSGGVLAQLAQYVHELELSGFASPIERRLAAALHDRGIVVRSDVVIAGHPLDLAIVRSDLRLDVECDGAAFHDDRDRDRARDRAISDAGWTVFRFSGRRITRDLEGCVEEVVARALLR